MPLHMRMPKHGFKSRSKKKTILKTDFLNFCFERNLIGKKIHLKLKILNLYLNQKKIHILNFLWGISYLKQ